MAWKTARTSGFKAGQNDTAVVADDFGKDQAALLLNVRPDFDGGAATRGGTRLRSAVVAGTLADSRNALFFFRGNGTPQLVAVVMMAAGTQNIYTSADALTWTSRATGLTAGSWSATSLRQTNTNYLLMVNGSHYKSWDGTTMNNITGIASGTKYIVAANRRLWASAGDVATASKIGDFNTWDYPDGLFLPITTDDGDTGIVGLGVLRSRVVVCKKRSVSFIDGFGNSDVIVAAGPVGISGSVGLQWPRTLLQAGDGGLCFRSSRGMELTNGEDVAQVGSGVRAMLSTFVSTTASGDLLDAPMGWYNPVRNEFGVLYANEGAVVNLTSGAAWRVSYADTHDELFAGICLAEYAIDGDTKPRLTAIDQLGSVYALEEGTKDVAAANGTGGATIVSQIDGALWDYGAPNRRKWGRILRATISGDGTATLQGLADGVAGNGHAAVVSGMTAGYAKRFKAGVSVRGVNLQARVILVGGQKLSGLELEARVYENVQG